MTRSKFSIVKFLLVVFCFLLCALNTEAAITAFLPDSIETKLAELKNDSARTRYLNELGFKNRFINPDFSDELINRSLHILSKYEDCYATSDAFGIKGNIADKHGKFRQALPFYFTSLNYAEKCNILNLKASNHNNIGLVYQRLQLYDSALYHLNLSIELKKKIGNRKSFASTYNNIGLVYYQQLKYRDALKYFLESLKLKEEFNDRSSASSTLLNLSNIYRELGVRDSAKSMVLKSIDIRKEFNDNWGLASSYNNLGLLLKDEKKWNEALAALNLSQKYATIVKDYENLVKTYNNIGDIYFEIKDYDKALRFIELAVKEAKKNSYTRSEQLGLTILSKIYLEKKHYDKAIDCINKSLSIADSIGDITGRKKALETLIEIKSKANQNTDALAILNEYKSLNDSVIYGKLAHELSEIQGSYEILKAKKTAEQLSLENKLKDIEIENIHLREKQRQTTIFVLLALLLLLVAGVVVYFKWRKKENQRLLIKSQDLAKMQERERIARDIHDELGTNLSRIALTAETALLMPTDEKHNILINISRLSRDVLTNLSDLIWYLNPQNLSLNDLLIRIRENITEYLSENNIDYSIDFELNSDIEIRSEHQRQFMLIIKEVVHNAVKHASCSKVTIKAEWQNQVLGILINDNGKGFNTSEKSSGNGIKNIKKRAEFLKAEIKYLSSSKGTTVVVTFPVTSKNETTTPHPFMLLTAETVLSNLAR